MVLIRRRRLQASTAAVALWRLLLRSYLCLSREDPRLSLSRERAQKKFLFPPRPPRLSLPPIRLATAALST
jgi:hypothetical protein